MKIQLFILILFVKLSIRYANGCSLYQLIDKLPYVSSPQSNCLANKECTNINCTIIVEKINSNIGLNLISCDTTPSIRMFANIPFIGIKNWSAIVINETEQIIPGVTLPNTGNQNLQAYLSANLKPVKTDSLSLSVAVKGCVVNGTAQYSCPLVKQILNNQLLFCNKTTLASVTQKHCTLQAPFSCAANEACQQIDYTQEGTCVCIPGYVLNRNGSCAIPTTENPSFTGNGSDASPVPSHKDPATVVVNIMVPILILVLITAVIFGAYKHGLIRRIQNHLRRQTFEEMSFGPEDDDPPLA